MHIDKSISVDGSNNAGVWTPDAAAILELFFKKYTFLWICWYKLLLKNVFNAK